MADSKVTGLIGLVAPASDDLLYVVNDPSGTTASTKLTVDAMDDYLSSSTKTLTNKSGDISQWTNDSGYTTPSSTDTLTNKTIDVNGNTFKGGISDINTQTGTTYTLVLTDRDKIVEMNNGSANTLTVPTNASVAFPVGTTLTVIQYGAGSTTVEGDTGVTVNGVSAGSVAVDSQYGGVALYKRATDEWIIVNKTTA